MFLNILFKLIDVSKYGVIYVGVQKNIGLLGLLFVIVCDDLIGKVCQSMLLIFDYVLMVLKDFMYNMLLMFFWYLVGLVFQWLKEQGGVEVMVSIN